MAQQSARAEQSTPRTDQRWLVAVCFVAGLAHFGWAMAHPDPIGSSVAGERPAGAAKSSELLVLHDRSPDEREYVALGLGLAERGEFMLPGGDFARRMPLYPAFLSLIFRSQPSSLWPDAIIFAQALLAWCSTVGIALIAFKLRDATAGVFAGITAALYAPFLYLQTVYLTETLIITQFVAAILVHVTVVLGSGSPIRRTVGVAGVSILAGLMALTRADAILLIVPFGLHAVFDAPRRGERLARCAAAMIPVVLIAGAWCARNDRVISRFTLSTIGGLNFHLGQNAGYATRPGLDNADYGAFDRLRAQGLGEVEADRRLFGEGLQFVREHPGEAALNGLRKFRIWFTPTIPSYGPLLIVLAAGFISATAWRGPRIRLAIPHRRERGIATAALALAIIAYGVHLMTSTRVMPFVSPIHVLALGIPSLILLRSRPPVRGLFIGLLVTQMVVAVVFIPISRLRWTMDPVLIIALAIGVSRVCRRLELRSKAPSAESTAASK